MKHFVCMVSLVTLSLPAFGQHNSCSIPAIGRKLVQARAETKVVHDRMNWLEHSLLIANGDEPANEKRFEDLSSSSTSLLKAAVTEDDYCHDDERANRVIDHIHNTSRPEVDETESYYSKAMDTMFEIHMMISECYKSLLDVETLQRASQEEKIILDELKVQEARMRYFGDNLWPRTKAAIKGISRSRLRKIQEKYIAELREMAARGNLFAKRSLERELAKQGQE